MNVPQLVPAPVRDGAAILVGALGAVVSTRLPHVPMLEEPPAGTRVELPGRGDTYVIDMPAPYAGAPTVVLLHGVACTAALNWAPAFRALSGVARVIAFDQRWHGQGVDAPEFSLEDCADDVPAVLDALGVPSAIVIGYSMGGMVAQHAAYRHPSRVEGLVLCSTAGASQGHAGERMFFPAFGKVMEALTPKAHAGVQRARAERIAAPATQPWTMTELSGTSLWGIGGAIKAIGGFDSAEWLGEVRVPAAVVVTAKDAVIPADRQRRLAETLGNAVVYEAPGGHVSVLVDAQTWVPVLLDAMQDVAARRRVAVAV